jgi:hypothetical protein
VGFPWLLRSNEIGFLNLLVGFLEHFFQSWQRGAEFCRVVLLTDATNFNIVERELF